ncbi:MAG: hypothetical protein AB4911_12650 [Oscillochloridaceae bacterium umkhey_bin13]
MTSHQCSTIRIATIIDALSEIVVPAAKQAAANDPRWLNALDRAYDWLLHQDAVQYDLATHSLAVASATQAGRSYTANGACQCRAYAEDHACWHRAAARLVRRALEHNAEAAQAQAQVEAWQAAELTALTAEIYETLAQADPDADWIDVQDAASAAAQAELQPLANFAAQWDLAADAARIRTLVARSAAALAA